MKDFEEKLKSMELREPPAELKARILKNATITEIKAERKLGHTLMALASSKWFLFLILPLMLFASAGVFALSVEERGAEKRWDEVERMLKAGGESLDFFAAYPKPVPDSENFMATPALAELELGTHRLSANHPRVLKYERLKALPQIIPPDPSQKEGERLDMARWQIASEDDEATKIGDLGGKPEEAFLALLEKDAALFEELELAALRPHSQTKTPIQDRLSGIYTFELGMGHLSTLQKLAKLTSLRAIACARLGDRETARASLEVLFKCQDCAVSDPMLINGLVGMTIRAILEARLPDILRESCWTEDDLKWLQEKVAEGGGFEEGLKMFRGEMSASARMYDEIIRMSPGERNEVLPLLHGSKFEMALMYFIPEGIYLRNKASSIQWMYEYNIVPLKERDVQGILRSGELLEAKLTSINWFSLGSILAKQTTFATGSIARKTLQLEMHCHMMETAVALERYQRVHGAFPTSLDALVPQFLPALPQDLFGEAGTPISYKIEGSGYLLMGTPLDSGRPLEFIR